MKNLVEASLRQSKGGPRRKRRKNRDQDTQLTKRDQEYQTERVALKVMNTNADGLVIKPRNRSLGIK